LHSHDSGLSFAPDELASFMQSSIRTNPEHSHRGWTVVLAGLAINLVLGVLYSWSVIAKALVVQWHWKATEASLPFTVSAAAFSVMMIFAGRWQDRVGPRYIAMIGGLSLGAGLVGSAFATTPLLMLITFGLIGGVGIGLGYSATTPPAIKWFPPEQKGLITGIVVSGIGLAAVYMAPLTQFMLRATSISTTFLCLGAGTVFLVCACSQLLKNPEPGYSPNRANASRPVSLRGKATGVDADWREMLATVRFYQLWLMFILAASAGLMIISQMALIARDQAHIETWGFAPVAALALFNTLGRLLAGAVSDRIGRAKTMGLAFALQAANMFAFTHYTSPTFLICGAALAGLCYGALFTLFPATTADLYGMRNLGVNYGLLFTGFGIAGTLGPILGARMRDHFHSYHYAFAISGTMLVVGALLTLTLPRPRTSIVHPASSRRDHEPAAETVERQA
jgi:OFA family oxalate/formate antiporter-like MFS transporter